MVFAHTGANISWPHNQEDCKQKREGPPKQVMKMGRPAKSRFMLQHSKENHVFWPRTQLFTRTGPNKSHNFDVSEKKRF